MILDKNNNQEHELYVKAMKALDSHNKVSEYKKVPETREEVAFMQETNQARTTNCFGLNIEEDKWNVIFGEAE